MHNCRIESLESRQLLTVLLFQPATGAFAAGSAVPQTYGSRVSAAIQAGFKYGTTGGFTPNVVAAYGTNGNTVVNQGANYGSLPNVATTANHAAFEMTLTADAGYQVSLSSIDLGAYPKKDSVIKSITVVDANSNKALYTYNYPTIHGPATGKFTDNHIVFASPLISSKLKIRYDASNLTSTNNVGIDNITFSQTKVAVVNGTLTGTVFNDVNGNGVQDAGETGLANWRVFLDANGDGIWQSTETSVLTSTAGVYSFSVAPGSYAVAEVVQSGWKKTAPVTEPTVAVTASKSTTVASFGNVSVTTGPAVLMPNVSIVHNSTGKLQISVHDTNAASIEDIEGMSFSIQISGGTGTTPAIQSVDLLTGTIWANTNAIVDSPAGGIQQQFQAYSVSTGSAGVYINPNGLLATITFSTANAAPGTYSIKLIGTRYPGFDSAFYNGAGNTVTSTFGSATLTVT